MVYPCKAGVVLLAPVPALMMVGACNWGSSESPFSPSAGGTLSLHDLVSSAAVGATQSALRQGFIPSTGAGSSAMASGNQTVVNGGTTAVEIATFERTSGPASTRQRAPARRSTGPTTKP